MPGLGGIIGGGMPMGGGPADTCTGINSEKVAAADSLHGTKNTAVAYSSQPGCHKQHHPKQVSAEFIEKLCMAAVMFGCSRC